MTFVRRHLPVLAILGAGLLLRLVLAYVVYPGKGYATDLGFFESWATTLARSGPGSIYATGANVNYPPGYLWILWLVGGLGNIVAAILGIGAAQPIQLLLKLPAILADVAIAALAYAAASRWVGVRAGLVAAALYLFVPVTWIDSAVWGQVDSVGALVAFAAVLALAEGWSELAAALAALAMLVKLQDAIVLAVVLPVLVRRHVLRPGASPQPAGRLAAAVDRRVGGVLTDEGPTRLATSLLAAAGATIVPLLPFDIARYAPASLADVPVVGHVAGLVGLFASLAGQFPVLTANAYNAWSLVGPSPLASAAGVATSGGSAGWTPDSIVLLGGLAASTIGAGLLLLVAATVAAGLLRRDGRLTLVLGLAVLMLAFYVLPTRVHERYLVPFFAPAALLAGSGLTAATGYVGLAIANSANLAAVLTGTLSFGLPGPGDGRVGAGDLGGFGARGDFGGAAGFRGGLGQGIGYVQLPLADLARNDVVIAAVALGQTLALAALVVVWLVVVLQPAGEPDAHRRPDPGPAGRASGVAAATDWNG